MPASPDFLSLTRLLATGRVADALVCHDGAQRVRWSEFSERVASLAVHLADRTEKRWAICCSNPLHFAAALFAVWHSGGRPVLPPNFQPGTLEQLRAAFDAVLTDGGEAPGLPTLDVCAASRTGCRLAPLDGSAGLDLYTSGSTGEPKCIAKSLAQLDAEVAIQDSLWSGELRQAAMTGTVPHHHIYGLLFRLLLPLASGRAFDTAVCADPDTLLARLDALGEAAVVSSPAMLSRLPELIDLARLAPAARLILSSGGPLPATAAAAFRHALGVAPTEIYGSTETGGIAWRRQAADAAWTPLPQLQVGADDSGALRLRSPFLPDGEWVTLEDAVAFLPDGRFLLKGRLDRVVKLEEKRLSLPDMEERLRQHPWVADAGVVVLPARGGQRTNLGAAVTLSTAGKERLLATGRREFVQELRRHLSAWFDAVLLPRRWRFPPALPVNERGKLTAEALAALFRDPTPR